VPRERGQSLHLGVPPDVYLVQRVSVGAHQFVDRPTEHQIADLRAHIVGVDRGPRERVSHLYRSVRRPAPRKQQAVLVRRPRHRLYRCEVVGELDHGLAEMPIPNQQFIVVSARTQLLLVEGPFQTTNLLLMATQPRNEGPAGPQIPLKDGLVPRASGKQGGTPGHRPNPQRMAL